MSISFWVVSVITDFRPDRNAHFGSVYHLYCKSLVLIDIQDFVFANLRLWQDMNHNGVSEVSELQALVAVNLKSISLDFSETRRRDRHGNPFRYR
jgi:hypothetical protein